MLPWLWLSALVIGLDQMTKWLIEKNFAEYEFISISSFFNLGLIYNKGAAFSLLAQQNGWQRWLFIILAIGISGLLIHWIKQLKAHETFVAISLSLILGGAIGNLIDRILYGKVIDFLDIHLMGYHWPAFNIADSAITLGVILILYDAFFGQKNAG